MSWLQHCMGAAYAGVGACTGYYGMHIQIISHLFSMFAQIFLPIFNTARLVIKAVNLTWFVALVYFLLYSLSLVFR